MPTTLPGRETAFPVFSAKEERELIRRAKDGDVKAKEQLIRSQFRMVTKLIRLFRLPDGSLPAGLVMDDMMQEAMIGFLDAIKRYDMNRPERERLMSLGAWRVHKELTSFMTDMRFPVKIQSADVKNLARLIGAVERGEVSDLELIRSLGSAKNQSILTWVGGVYSFQAVQEEGGALPKLIDAACSVEDTSDRLMSDDNAAAIMDLMAKHLTVVEALAFMLHAGLITGEGMPFYKISDYLPLPYNIVKEAAIRARRKLISMIDKESA